MLEAIQYSSSGKQPPERESISQSKQTLNNDQIKLINDNIVEIQKIISKILSKNKRFRCRIKDSVSESISYLPDVTLEYDENSLKKMSFSQFASNRCVLRLMDQYRRLNKHIRANFVPRSKINKIKEDLLNTVGYCNELDIAKRISENGGNPEKDLKIVDFHEKQIDNNALNISKRDVSLDQIDCSDFLENIKKQAEKFFLEHTDESLKYKSLSSKIHKILICDYLIPKCQGQQYKTLQEISSLVGLKISRLSQIIHGERMKGFINYIYQQ